MPDLRIALLQVALQVHVTHHTDGQQAAWILHGSQRLVQGWNSRSQRLVRMIVQGWICVANV